MPRSRLMTLIDRSPNCPVTPTIKPLNSFRRQTLHDAGQPHGDGLRTSGNDDQVAPVKHGQRSEMDRRAAAQQPEGDPGSNVQHDHPPRLGHNAAELPAHAQRLTESPHVGGQQGEDRRPIAACRVAQPAALLLVPDTIQPPCV